MRIRQLPPFIANQIAAGEVIERPASVVKELLENALDAGADIVNIDIGAGGLNQIKVSDNGAGIIADDLQLAVAAHATSKIQEIDDLYSIHSMGFRGEALASIASVSRMWLSSKPATQNHAMMLQMNEHGINQSPCARNQGTTIDVQDLFFNTPVRKKFLKTERLEFQAIEMVVKRFALSAPSIALTLKHNGKQTLALPAATCDKSCLLRIKKLLGKEFIEQAIYLDVEHGDIRLNGWISGPSYQRSQRDKQWVYLNRRMIKDKLLFHAIQQAYQLILHPGRFPVCLLYLTMPANEVDVNVHPTKHEVRFQDPRMIHDVIVSSVTRALESAEYHSERSEGILYTQEMSCNDAKLGETSPIVCHPEPSRHPERSEGSPNANQISQDPRYQQLTTSRGLTAGSMAPSRATIAPDIKLSWHILNPQFAIVELHNHPHLIHLRQLHHNYSKMMLLECNAGSLSRPLLVPISYPIETNKYTLFEQYQSQLAVYGIQFDFIGKTAIAIRTIPKCLPLLNINELLHYLHNDVLESTELLAYIIRCQTFDAYQCTIEEKTDLMLFLQKQQLPNDYCVRLDMETCLNLVNNG